MSKIFICHASEDKDEFVRPLAIELINHGLELWYDELSLKPGDSLRRSIEHGLSKCSLGLVVLSPTFFAKEWPQRELDALYSAELSGKSKIIPIWYGIDTARIISKFPLMADRIAIKATDDVSSVAEQIVQLNQVKKLIKAKKFSGSDLADKIEFLLELDELDKLGECLEDDDEYTSNILSEGRQHRFLELNACKQIYTRYLDENTADISEKEINEEMKCLEEKLKLSLNIPKDVYLVPYGPVGKKYLDYYINSIKLWSSGTLSRKDSAALIYYLDIDDFDQFYILLNIPNFSISSDYRTLLESLIVEMGCGFDECYGGVRTICKQLRNQN